MIRCSRAPFPVSALATPEAAAIGDAGDASPAAGCVRRHDARARRDVEQARTDARVDGVQQRCRGVRSDRDEERLVRAGDTLVCRAFELAKQDRIDLAHTKRPWQRDW